jgi:hypothetical protein
MEDLTLKDIWRAQDEKLDRTLKLNLFIIDSLQKQKVRSKLGALANFKLIVAVLGILWVVFLGLLIYGNRLQNMYFTISVAVIFVFNVIAVIVYFKHYVLLKKINYSESITTTQQKLASLQVSTINIVRVLLLQTPFYSTWFWTQDQVMHSSKFWMISFPVTMLFVAFTVWLYISISPRNINKKKWVSRFMNVGMEYKSVTQARNFLAELEEFKMDSSSA